MRAEIALPAVNIYGTYEIRLESIGGLGANLCGKILGELGALYLGLNSCSFASYGSEKKGSPVKSFIRYANADTEIRLNSPVESPHLLGVFYDGLTGFEAAGADESTNVVVNSKKTPAQMRERMKLYAGTIHCIDALQIAIDKKTRVNMVMLGALAKASGFIPLEIISAVVTDTIGKKYPGALAGNIAGIEAGYNGLVTEHFKKSDYPYLAYEELESDWGYENSPIGGINPRFGSTVTNDLTGSREGKVPMFIKEKCINCGLCDITCPDMVFQFAEGEYKGKRQMLNQGADYHHCKGCMRCVEICPTAAIIAKPESETDIKAMHVRNRALIVAKLEFEDAGQNSYVESESEAVNGAGGLL